MTHLNSIQSLRAIAALLVVAFHVSDGAFVTGAAGVDIFFVISGFIMGTVGVRETPLTFLKKRVVRIVPLYWAVTLFMCTVSLFGLFARFNFEAGQLLKSLFFIPYFDPSGHIWPLVVVGWTLNLEILFYAVFAFALLAGMPVRLSAAILVLLVLGGYGFAPAAAPLQLWTSPLLLEFVAGLLLATVLQPAGRFLGLVLITLAAVALAAIGAANWFEPEWRILAWGIPSAMIVAGALAIERAGAWPTRALKPLEAIGDASYSLYLLHGLVIAFAHRLIGDGLMVNLAIVVASIGIALVSFHLFERPVGRFLGRVGSQKDRPSA
ncbi:acyltransferase family protein [Aureimonas glaciei]|uniref:Acyltransferase n=1 Tax=Aureimonas glaciei TaxID=1776957 RepID=A0A916YH08_9HYPH|nr:acyltransferase [Aureimonas glaciei]GGD43107.1 acyltransferase [Aureimonas glaciei]